MLTRRITRAGARLETVLADADGLCVFFELTDPFGVPPEVHKAIHGTSLPLLESQAASGLEGGGMIYRLVVGMRRVRSVTGVVVQSRVGIQSRRFLVQLVVREVGLV